MKIIEDAINANYIYRNGYVSTLSQERKDTLIGKNIFHRIKFILSATIKEFFVLIKDNKSINIKNKTVCLVNSHNNLNALAFLKSGKTVYYKFTVLGNNIQDCNLYYLKNKFYYSLLFILLLPLLLVKKENRLNLILLHKAFGIKSIFKNILIANRPQKLVFANDHTPEMRSFLLAAKEAGIETIYVQHGSVSKYFPTLIFDLALLDSQYSLDIYSSIGVSHETAIELIGIPKLDEQISYIRNRDTIKIIGLAINQNDEIEKITEIIDVLISSKYQILFRKHPLDYRNFAFINRASVIDGNQYGIFEFIHSIDFLIAADSSIHVEANSLQCRSLYYPLHSNKNKKDYYEFIKNDYIDAVNSPKSLINYLNNFNYTNFDFFSADLKYYNEALNSEFYGRSAAKAIKLIKKN